LSPGEIKAIKLSDKIGRMQNRSQFDFGNIAEEKKSQRIHKKEPYA
jgi:hypothetical protein